MSPCPTILILFRHGSLLVKFFFSSLLFLLRFSFQGPDMPLPLNWDGFNKWFDGWVLVLTDGDLRNSPLIHQGLRMYNPRELLVFVAAGVQGCVILDPCV